MIPMMLIAMRKAQEKAFFLLAISLLISAMLLVFLLPGFWPLSCALLLFFIGFNFLEASLPALVSRVAPAGQRGSAMGIYSSSQFFGAFLGGAFGGAVVQHYGYQALFAVLAVIGLIWLAVASTLNLPQRAQRLSLVVSLQHEQQAGKLADALARLNGVQEVTIVLAEQRCYLKVSSAQFDHTAAQAVITAAGA